MLETLVSRFVDASHHDPQEGYVRDFYHFLLSVNDEQELLAKIRLTSDKSGEAVCVSLQLIMKQDEV